MVTIIPWLAGVFATAITFFTTYLGKKVAMVAAALSVSTALFVAFALTISGLISSFQHSLPSWAAGGVMFLPENLSTSISAVITAKLARLVYDYHRENLRLASYIT